MLGKMIWHEPVGSGGSSLKMLLCLGNRSDERHRFDGEAPEDAHDLWETVLRSIVNLGEKV